MDRRDFRLGIDEMVKTICRTGALAEESRSMEK